MESDRDPDDRMQDIAAGIYLVGTPIGNLGDASGRLKRVLAAAGTIAAEDTRVARRLLSALGIPAPKLVRCDETISADIAPKLADAARTQVVAFVSDAGMPGIADPGAALVRAADAAGVPVTAVPGPSALATALALSGLPAEPFLFLGFLPAKAGPRSRRLAEFRDVKATLVAFESPHRLGETLAAMETVLGSRAACVLREMTKLHEERRPGTLGALAAHYAAAGEPRGEIVVVVGPPVEGAADPLDPAALDRHIAAALKDHGVRDAADRVAAATGLPRRQVYARALELAGKTRK
ncbi:MAG: 16S rRNA (cytidine(1402)-2'-O)-methyltransferase [Alphaproteobacteria bacterium]|nr:16S rRNA (cytidine(1402)-2'-O)-methyltransferase [Alphaproteobacteria bacterium]